MRVDSNSAGHKEEFNNVKTSFTTLILRNKRLRFIEGVSKRLLSYASGLSRIY